MKQSQNFSFDDEPQSYPKNTLVKTPYGIGTVINFNKEMYQVKLSFGVSTLHKTKVSRDTLETLSKKFETLVDNEKIKIGEDILGLYYDDWNDSWKIYKDEKTKQSYWHNSNTGISTWNEPENSSKNRSKIKILLMKLVPYYLKQKLHTKALNVYEWLLNNTTDITEKYLFYYYKTLCYYEMKEYENALLNINECLQIDPKYYRSYLFRAWIYINLQDGKNSLVIKDYNKALEYITNSNTDIYFPENKVSNVEIVKSILRELKILKKKD